MADTLRSPRVGACIQNAMEKYWGGSPRRDLTYYKNVHQDLAPLARELENALLSANARIAQLEQALASRPAEVDDEGLPPLPESKFCAWLQHGQAVNAFSRGVGDKARWDRDGYWSGKGFDRAPLFTAEQFRQGQRDAIAADRARHAEIFQAQVENGNWCDIEESALPDWESMQIRTRRLFVAPSHTTNKDSAKGDTLAK